MSERKLMFLISTHGKTPEQVGKEAREAFVHYQATELGLTKCGECGEYKGEAVRDGEPITVKCICDGILCTSCEKVRIRRPISNHFSEQDAKIWHTPYFLHICPDCRK